MLDGFRMFTRTFGLSEVQRCVLGWEGVMGAEVRYVFPFLKPHSLSERKEESQKFAPDKKKPSTTSGRKWDPQNLKSRRAFTQSIKQASTSRRNRF